MNKSVKKAIYLIIFIGLLTYFNFLFNDFTYEDFDLILANPLLHSITNIFSFFTYLHESPFLNNLIKNQMGNFYRPLSLTYLSLIYSLSGQHPLLLNISQIALHITNSALILIFLQKFLKLKIAFILSLFFLVHPLNTEAVSHIGISDLLFFFFGMLALDILLYKTINYRNKILISALMLSSILAKETGTLFIISSLILSGLFIKEHFKYLLVSNFIISLIYIFLRFVIAQPYLYKEDYGPVINASVYERVITIPSIILYYLKTFIFPNDLEIAQQWIQHTISINNFFLPLAINLLFFTVISIYLLRLWRTKNSLLKPALLFTVWFVLGLLPHLQLLPLTTIVAGRWFYFPFVGILGFTGVVIQNIKLKENFVKFIMIIYCLIIMALVVRTNYRILDWRNNLSLYEHDLKNQKNNYALTNNLGSEYMKLNRVHEAKELFIQSTKSDPKGWINWTNLGNIYFADKNFQKASEYYEIAIENGDYELAYMNYGILLITTNKPQEAKDLVTKALIKYPFNFKFWRIIALADKQLGNKKEALEAAQKANLLYTDQDGLRLYQDLIEWSGLTKDFKKY